MGVRVRLETTTNQRHALLSHAGAARFTYSWGLELRQKAYVYAGAREDAISLHKLLNSLKAEHYPWMYEVSKCAPQEALRDLDKAYENWWRRLKEGKRGRKAGAQVAPEGWSGWLPTHRLHSRGEREREGLHLSPPHRRRAPL